METKNELSEIEKSMEVTLKTSNLEFVEDFGEIIIDSIVNENILREVPIIRAVVGVGKIFKNIVDAHFAKKLITFLFFSIRNTTPEERSKAISKWEKDENFRGKVGETLIGMILRCDDSVKAKWLSKLFYEMVLKNNESRLFMRAEKVLSALSVMDVYAFLHMPIDKVSVLSEQECEPYIGSGLYTNPEAKLNFIDDEETLSLGIRECKLTEIGRRIHSILQDTDK